MLAEPLGSAEPWLKITELLHIRLLLAYNWLAQIRRGVVVRRFYIIYPITAYNASETELEHLR